MNYRFRCGYSSSAELFRICDAREYVNTTAGRVRSITTICQHCLNHNSIEAYLVDNFSPLTTMFTVVTAPEFSPHPAKVWSVIAQVLSPVNSTTGFHLLLRVSAANCSHLQTATNVNTCRACCTGCQIQDIIKSCYSLWSIGHPWRDSWHCDLQLFP